MSLLLLAWAQSLCFSDQQERRLGCLDMLFVLLGAFPLINNWEPNDDNNMLGHPANYITAAYEKQNVRGAHWTRWKWGHKGLTTTTAAAAAAAHLSIHFILLVPAEQQCPLLLIPETCTQQCEGGFRAEEREGRATRCWGEVMAQHIRALTALWRQINS